MPTYEYECKSCGRVMDLFQSITAAPLRKAHCDACGKDRPVRRLIGTGGGLIFKGSGFYQTDYRSEGYKNAAKAESASGSSASSDNKAAESPKSGEAKPAAPAATSTPATPPAGEPSKPERRTSRRRKS